jgi:hypothetical protein
VSLEKDFLTPGERFLSTLYDRGTPDEDIHQFLWEALRLGQLTREEFDRALAFHLGE